jgi:hypothetical protein
MGSHYHLYPRNVYRCPLGHPEFYSRAEHGAVTWRCPDCGEPGEYLRCEGDGGSWLRPARPVTGVTCEGCARAALDREACGKSLVAKAAALLAPLGIQVRALELVEAWPEWEEGAYTGRARLITYKQELVAPIERALLAGGLTLQRLSEPGPGGPRRPAPGYWALLP